MVNCNYENYGCMGGYLMTTIDYLMTEGVVPRDCIPYQEARDFCTYRCYDGLSDYDKYYCKPGSMLIATTHDQIKRELV